LEVPFEMRQWQRRKRAIVMKADWEEIEASAAIFKKNPGWSRETKTFSTRHAFLEGVINLKCFCVNLRDVFLKNTLSEKQNSRQIYRGTSTKIRFIIFVMRKCAHSAVKAATRVQPTLLAKTQQKKLFSQNSKKCYHHSIGWTFDTIRCNQRDEVQVVWRRSYFSRISGEASPKIQLSVHKQHRIHRKGSMTPYDHLHCTVGLFCLLCSIGGWIIDTTTWHPPKSPNQIVNGSIIVHCCNVNRGISTFKPPYDRSQWQRRTF
jgi:hypothetical protein